ncbi:virulence factor SrfC family protein [uncultured Thiodictyon sp.]|uniref:virulence factor SrfC family protein n=1 Tax=uncultured Thiodictyon sp. TaxID=1846217 RepID=UPI0025CE2AAF|nr:virulence factor SrfC family protein [uncultured Thiodictyon sp.]
MQRCLQIRDACGGAIAWVEANRGQSPRLDQESAALTLHLRRARNQARALARTADRPFAVGLFGLSQSGKSYLLSAVAANPSGRLDLAVGDDTLDFLTHVNPPGGGKEATGLVTRLTRRPVATAPGFPVRLHLLSAADLVKVLGNAFFNDFDRERTPFEVDSTQVREQLAALEQRRRRQPVPGMDADDVIDIQDYFEQRFPHSTYPLKADFWPTATALVADLEPDDRAELFSLLWGGVPELTQTFRLLCQYLAKLGFAAMLDCPLAVLVAPAADGGWTPAGSIVDVDVLDRLGKDLDDTLRVLPIGRSPPADAVAIPRSVLAALTAEIELVLATPPKAEVLNQVDLLDFPGYRGRLAIANLADVRRQLRDDQLDPVAQLVLRGKVAYLFERYTEGQAMNALILCTPSNQQSDVSDLGEVIASWVNLTQGPDPATRALHRPALLWALTKFDQRLDVLPGQTVDGLQNYWAGMIKLVLEHFGKYQWVQEWTPGECFDNLFPVRKPGKAGAVIDTQGEQELAVRPDRIATLTLARTTFCAEPLVRKHVREPALAWDAMLTLNDGGVSRLMEQLTLVVDHDARLRQLRHQMDTLAAGITDQWLRRFYRAEGLRAATDKKAQVTRIVEPLLGKTDRIGDLMALLQPSRDQLRSLYLRTDQPDEVGGGAQAPAPSGVVGISLAAIFDDGIADAAPSAPLPPPPDRAARFARDAMRSWVQQLKDLTDQEQMRGYFGLPRQQFDDLIDELVTGADRLGLEQVIAAALRGDANLAGALRQQLASRQVDAVYFVLCAFIDQLESFEPPVEGDATRDRPAAGRPGNAAPFAPPPPIATGQVPDLAPHPEPFTTRYITDWLRALVALAVNNAGHQVGQEIPADQNRRLGEILAALAGDGRAEVKGSP